MEDDSPLGGIIFIIILVVLGSWIFGGKTEDTGSVLSDNTYTGSYEPEITYFDENGYDTNDRSNPPTFEDDPYTTNDETNDQPTGYYGTDTVEACNESSGNCYELDADFDGEMVTAIYFPKGGNLDFYDGYCEDTTCYGTSEEGDEWYFNLN